MPGRFRFFGRSRAKPGVDVALVRFRDKLVCEAQYWGEVADEEDADSLRRACMAVRSHAFAQAAAHADDVLVRVFCGRPSRGRE